MSPRPDAVPRAERGRTIIADRAVQRLAAAAARELDEEWQHRVVAVHADAAVESDRVSLGLTVQVLHPAPALPIATALRDHVTLRTRTLTALAVTRLDVTIVPTAQTPRRVA
ncbi:MAG TPA: hypothetical protein VFZ37_12325 [Jiangellaceae bacterium]